MEWSILDVGGFFSPTATHLAKALAGTGRVIPAYGHGVTTQDWEHGKPLRKRIHPGATIPDVLFGQVLILWNGSFTYQHRIVAAARERGMAVACMENGLFPGRIQMDPDGVNAKSSAMHLTLEALAGCPVADDIWESGFKQRSVEFTAGDVPLDGDTAPLPERFAFFPYQLDQDTQILLHSPRITSMRQALEQIVPGLPADLPLVAKEHPSARTRVGSAAIRRDFPSVTFCRYRSCDELLAQAALCVTINSSVGVQALARRVPTVVLGNAIYGRPEWCTPVADLADLPAALAGARDRPVDYALLGAWLTWCRDRWLVRWDFTAMAARALDIAEGRRPWLGALCSD